MNRERIHFVPEEEIEDPKTQMDPELLIEGDYKDYKEIHNEITDVSAHRAYYKDIYQRNTDGKFFSFKFVMWPGTYEVEWPDYMEEVFPAEQLVTVYI